MNYYKRLYVGDSVKNHERIIELLEEGVYVYGTHLICVKKNIDILLTIIDAKQIFNPSNNYKDYMVIGLTNGKKEAHELTKEIIFSYYQKNKGLSGFRKSFYLKD